jgi:hypothetical protein
VITFIYFVLYITDKALISIYVPCYLCQSDHILVPTNAGPQMPVTISPNQPVYSTYSSKQVWTGPMPFGIPTDAPIGHPFNGKNFHVIEHIPTNNSFMVHEPRGW